MQVRIELPNLRVPVGLIVDDGMPGYNPLAFHRLMEGNQHVALYKRRIHGSFMDRFCDMLAGSDIRGCFSIVPAPLGLGRIDTDVDGIAPDELRAWLDLARTHVAPRFDIHCELLTHLYAMDIDTMSALPLNEQEWAETQNRKSLARYFRFASDILRNAGFEPNGVTQPWTFRGDERMYARAVMDAEPHRAVTHHFIHMDQWAPHVPPRTMFVDRRNGRAGVSIWAATDDYLWPSVDPTHPQHRAPPDVLADSYISADGKTGRLADLIRNGSPAMFVTHWQGLFSNGQETGLAAMGLVAQRLKQYYRDRIEWVRPSQLAARHVAAEHATIRATTSTDKVNIAIGSKFDTDVITVSFALPWPSDHPRVLVNNKPLHRVGNAAQLRAGSWMQNGFHATVSIPLKAHAETDISLERFYK